MNKRVFHSSFTMIIMIIITIVFLHLSSHLISTHCFWFFTYCERESIRSIKDIEGLVPWRVIWKPFCRSPSLSVNNNDYYPFKSLSILGYHIGYLLLFVILDHIFVFVKGFSCFIIIYMECKQPQIFVRVTCHQGLKWDFFGTPSKKFHTNTIK